jgi:hypothetical protein|tara:strand:+ start:119 stop:466 length:348 start_codon:yes stop_codon:yes gene_type:complete
MGHQITQHLDEEQHKQWVYNTTQADIADTLGQLEKMTMPMPVNHPDYLDVRVAYEELMEVCMTTNADGQIPSFTVLTYLARLLHQLRADPRMQEASAWSTHPYVLTEDLVQTEEA